MAFDIKTFRVRALSAVVFGAIMLAALLGGATLFFCIFAAIAFIAGKEFYRLFCKIKHQPENETIQLLYGLAVSVMYMAIAHSNGATFIAQINDNVNIYAGAAILLSVLWMAMLNFNKFSVQLFLGYVYISLSFALLAQCYHTDAHYPLMLIVLIWINDTMQYIVGSFIGKTKMAPIISPKKTWEGTIGGSLLAVLVAIVCGIFFKQYPIGEWIAFGLVASIAGTIGDLVESKLKRTAGVKDSGNIMPGHGGALDRFDSLLLAGPCLWFVLKMIL
jgi:phosphatidate cytidylyltransferase